MDSESSSAGCMENHTDERSLSEAEQQAVADALACAYSEEDRRSENWTAKWEYTPTRLAEWHRSVFGEVRPQFAGRLRGSDFGQEYNLLGRHRSVHRNDVADALQKHCRQTLDLIDAVESGKPGPEDLIRAAVSVHCNLIRIQPFHDGNKTIARFVMRAILARWNILAPVFVVPRQEYLGCVEAYLAFGDHSCLVELVIRLADESARLDIAE